MALLLWPYKITKHNKNRGFDGQKGKPKMALLVSKVPFWEGASKGACLSVIPKSCVLLKTQQSTALQTWKSVTWKTTIYQNKGLFAKMQRVFFGLFFFVFWFCFFFSVFLCFCFVKRPKTVFPWVLEVFSFLSPNRPVFKILLFVLLCFFPFVLPFKISYFFFAFCPSTPFGKHLFFWVSFVSFSIFLLS